MFKLEIIQQILLKWLQKIANKDLILEKFANKDIRFSDKNIQSSVSLARCAYDKYLKGEYGDSSNISPLYLRKSQAERAMLEQ